MELQLAKDKRGLTLADGAIAVVTIILVATLVIVAIYMYVSLSDSFVDVSSETVTWETFSAVSYTPVTASNATACNFEDFAVTTARNATSDTVITAANYTVDSTAGTIVMNTGIGADTAGINGSDWEVTYTYNWGSEACDASEDTITEFADYPGLIGMVGVIVFLGIVIGVLVGVTYLKRRP